jgi:glycerate-2-kinase
LGEAKENNLAVCLISKGGSALAKEVIRFDQLVKKPTCRV